MFITFEGIDGSGKTTQSELLYSYITYDLQNEDKCYLTSEPYDDNIRTEILNKDNKSKLYMYLNDRRKHIDEIIQPKLKEDVIVICDRYEDSTIAYQYYGDNILSTIDEIKICNFKKPNLTFLLTLDINKSIDRIKKRDKIFNINILFFLLLIILDSFNFFKKHVSQCFMELDSVLLTRHFLILKFFQNSVFRLKNTFLNVYDLFSFFKQS